VLGVFLELPTYLPTIGSANTEESLQSASIGVLILAFLWFRPQGIFPERRRQLPRLIQASARSTDREVPGDLAPGLAPTAPGTAFHWHAPARPGGAEAAATLSVRDLRREFGGVNAVDGLSFNLAPGQVTGLIGPNGAGKSTALKLIAGAVRPSAGHVVVDGTDVAGWPAHKVARLGVVRTFQHTSEFARLTVLENLLTAAPGQPGDSLHGALLGRRHSRGRQRGPCWRTSS
jgi:ABC-type multidrug transport system fused ATPase/permease subunit